MEIEIDVVIEMIRDSIREVENGADATDELDVLLYTLENWNY